MIRDDFWQRLNCYLQMIFLIEQLSCLLDKYVISRYSLNTAQ